MATILSTPTSLTMRAPGTSALALLATSMPPGTWAKLSAGNQDASLGVGTVSGTMIHYCNSMPWNPVSKCIEIIGQDHSYPALRHVRYDDASNAFVLVADNAGIATGHGYDHNAVNPYTGDLYHRLYSGFTGQIQVRKKALGASSFTTVPSVAGGEQVSIGACWWSGSFVGAGSQGCFMIFNSGNANNNANDGQIVAFDPLAGKWIYNQEGRAPNYGSGATYNSVMEYSQKKNVAVYGGGNVAPNRLWRLSADGSFATMPNTPAGATGVGMQKGLLVDEPVTGNFLLLSAGQLWELNPTGSGSWTQMTGSRVPPAGVGLPDKPTAMFCTSIPEYGVVAFVTQPNQAGGTFFLYKHA